MASEKIVNFPDMSVVEAEAAAWVARLDKGKLSGKEYEEFQEWQRRSASHREALARLSALWSDLLVLEDLTPPFRSREPADEEEPRFRSDWAKLALAAASVVAILVGSFWYMSTEPTPRGNRSFAQSEISQLNFETLVGAQKTVVLPDGSKVALNTDSQMEVEFSKGLREVRLKRGEAYFDVVHDEKRPFSVMANGRRIKDIGTAFDVRLLQNAVDVTVTHGSVELAAQAERNSRETGLGTYGAGHNIVFDRQILRSQSVSESEMARRLSWREGGLRYSGEPLSTVLEDVKRYTGIMVDVRDPTLNDLPVGGYFEIKKLHNIFFALEKNFGIRAQWLNEKHVELFRNGRLPVSARYGSALGGGGPSNGPSNPSPAGTKVPAAP